MWKSAELGDGNDLRGFGGLDRGSAAFGRILVEASMTAGLVAVAREPGHKPGQLRSMGYDHCIADFLGDARSSDLAIPGLPSPDPANAPAMPSDRGVWFHDHQAWDPSGPHPAQQDPERADAEFRLERLSIESRTFLETTAGGFRKQQKGTQSPRFRRSFPINASAVRASRPRGLVCHAQRCRIHRLLSPSLHAAFSYPSVSPEPLR